MKDAEITKIDRLALLMVRQGKEKSRALPANQYGDPAKHVKFEREKEATMNDKELYAYVQDWLKWCQTRKFYVRNDPQNILSRMQPQRVGRPPDAKLSVDLNFFNMAVHTIFDMRKDDIDAECFAHYYGNMKDDIVKVIAAKHGVCREAYYRNAKRFARKALEMAPSLKQVSESFGMVGIDANQD